MNFLRSALLPILALTASPALGEDAESLVGDAGDFHIVQLWTTDPDNFLRAWQQSSPPTLLTSSRMERNQPIQQFIVFSNCTADDAGNCRLSARVDISSPDGTPYGDPIEFEALPESLAPPPDVLSLAPSAIGLVIEDGEQLGRYSIVLAVTDENAGVTAKSSVSLDAVEQVNAGARTDTLERSED